MADKPRWRPKVCRHCGKPGSSKSPLSIRGLHGPCGELRMVKTATQIRDKSGPAYEQWRQGMIDHARQLASQ